MLKFTDRIFLRLPVLPAEKKFLLNEIMHDTFFMEGIQIASPVLFDEACRFKDENINSEPNKKLVRSLLKYFQRASYRCTPFGLFSACTVANWVEQGNGIIGTNHSRSTRLDMHFSVALQQHLASLPQIKSELYFFRNNSVSILLDKLRFTEYFYKNNQRKHVLSEVDYSVYLEKILQRANDGATIHELVQQLVSVDIDLESAKKFIEELVLNQILVSELEVSVSGDELLADLIVKLQRVYSRKPENNALLSEIKQLELILDAINCLDTNLVNEKSAYDKVILLLKYYPIELDNSKLFQVDTFIHNTGQHNVVGLPVSTQKSLIEAIHFLCKINGRSTNLNLQNFISEFTKKYDTRAVPLLEVMDNEFGLGYGSTLKRTNDVNELTEGIITTIISDETTIRHHEIQQFLESKLLEAVTNNSYTVSFDKNSLKSFDDKKAAFPDSMAVHFSVLNKDFSSFNILLKGIWGPSSTSILGRFASGSDEINQLVRQIVSHEEKLNENRILAEIVHLPENRTGNVLLRPSFRKFEIPYLASSSLAKEYVIELSDLYLQMQNSRLVLWSKKHGREVLPRLSNAHNYSYNALPIYHFLCDFQAQDVQPGTSFSWGNIQHQLKFLPAAVFEKVILFPATWQFNRDDIQAIISWKAPDQLEKLFEWKKKWRIPDRFYLSEGDNDLLIHLAPDQSLMIDLFLSEISTRKNIILKEFLFDLKNPFVVSSDESGYTNEFIAPVLRQNPTSIPVSNPLFNELKRTFIPGSEWIYYKIYCGEKTAERILLELVYPLSTEICDTLKLAEKWFFIRYADPDHHIRIRFYAHSVDSRLKLMN
ncbi:MAG: lantibiotic dehydratase [Crocinitomicaceae bacterium]|nr:lantibiotic dehydratase [Crocinitomicaceae bacterium]